MLPPIDVWNPIGILLLLSRSGLTTGLASGLGQNLWRLSAAPGPRINPRPRKFRFDPRPLCTSSGTRRSTTGPLSSSTSQKWPWLPLGEKSRIAAARFETVKPWPLWTFQYLVPYSTWLAPDYGFL